MPAETIPYCFVCDAPAEGDPCPTCGYALYHPTEEPSSASATPTPTPLLSHGGEPKPAQPRRKSVYLGVAVVIVLLLILLVSFRWAAGIVQ